MLFHSKKNIHHLIKICTAVGLFILLLNYITQRDIKISYKFKSGEGNNKSEGSKIDI